MLFAATDEQNMCMTRYEPKYNGNYMNFTLKLKAFMIVSLRSPDFEGAEA